MKRILTDTFFILFVFVLANGLFVLGDEYSAIRTNPVRFFGIALLVSALAALVLAWIRSRFQQR